MLGRSQVPRHVLGWGVGSVLCLVIVAGLGSVPVRTWLSQRTQEKVASAELSELTAEINDLTQQLEQLRTDEEIIRRARRDFAMAFPGDERYIVVPVADVN